MCKVPLEKGGPNTKNPEKRVRSPRELGDLTHLMALKRAAAVAAYSAAMSSLLRPVHSDTISAEIPFASICRAISIDFCLAALLLSDFVVA